MPRSTKYESVGAEFRRHHAVAVIEGLLEIAKVVVATFDGEIVVKAPSRNKANCRAVVVDDQPIEIFVQSCVANAGAKVEIAGMNINWGGYESKTAKAAVCLSFMVNPFYSCGS